MKNTSNNADYKKSINLKRKRARAKRIRRLLLTIIIVTAAIIFARSSFFIVDEIKVTGNKKYSSNDIIFNTGLITGQNVFKMLGEKPKNLISFRFKDREQNVYESMPYVKSVSVRPMLPKAIRIKIQERTPFAILEYNGTSILIDKEGYALETIKNPDIKKKYFKIIGTLVDSYNLGQEVKFKGESPLQLVILFCDTLLKSDKNSDIKLYDKFTSIKVSDISSVTANFEGRIDGEFGDLDNLEYDLKVFKQIFTNNITKNQKGTLVFSTGSEHPYFVPKD
ncbi:FtsQ-type POTRA domain-containing protein [Ruminiclostridium herbifermentans]|uniref:FtsQ-type POTRA domain-containing protein n=1 Tax=Ruminiclostridium herbifermentans TaxID=2488810 RepID=A0A4U7JL49_9FIRM|nr:FtsQ-type POTRA domain-containing protein [Ruminiclostridium herbifermentans]QNU68368.1 FtsQ-type POTRA domain-containing protein [Ruminiclostridium herbifermentans]